MNKNISKLMTTITLFSLMFPLVVQAFEFNKNNVISDIEVQDYNSMDQVEIRDFLKANNSYLTNYFYYGNNPGPVELAQDPEAEYFKERSASEIIYNAAQESKINPKFLLTMLQKEMSLITLPNPVENRLNYAMGYGCPDGGGCDFKYKGFGKQVRAAAQQFRHFIDNIYEYKHRPGYSSCVDDPTPYLPCTASGEEVRPENAITAALYIYTPHVASAYSFVDIWNDFNFADLTGSTPSVITGVFPEGSLVKAKDGADTATVYLINNGVKQPFETMTALISRYDPNKILVVNSEEINKYETGAIIKYPNYSVLEGPDTNLYLIDGLEKRLITSTEIFRQLGFNTEELIPVSREDLNNIADGPNLTTSEISPFAELLMDMETGGVYYVKDGQKEPIIDPIILKANYPNLKVKEVTAKTLEQYPKVGPVKLINGTLIKIETNKNVYVISNSQRRLIPDGDTFNALGYNWANILVVPNKVMNLHQLGDPLSL